MAISSLLKEPNIDASCPYHRNSEAAHLYKANRREYEFQAREWTKKYAS